MQWLLSIFAGLLAAPVGAVLSIAIVYPMLMLGGVSEREGKRGLLAGALGIIAGLPAGFYAGFRLAWWLMS